MKGINNNTDATAEEARKKLQERRQANITIGKDFDSTLNIIEALISRSGAMGDVSVVAPLLQSMKDQLEIANSRPPALSNTRVTGP